MTTQDLADIRDLIAQAEDVIAGVLEYLEDSTDLDVRRGFRKLTDALNQAHEEVFELEAAFDL